MKPYPKAVAANFPIYECILLERKDGNFCDVVIVMVNGYTEIAVLAPHRDDLWTLVGCLTGDDFGYKVYFNGEDYNKTWRVWPGRPSVEESRCVPWG